MAEASYLGAASTRAGAATYASTGAWWILKPFGQAATGESWPQTPSCFVNVGFRVEAYTAQNRQGHGRGHGGVLGVAVRVEHQLVPRGGGCPVSADLAQNERYIPLASARRSSRKQHLPALVEAFPRAARVQLARQSPAVLAQQHLLAEHGLVRFLGLPV